MYKLFPVLILCVAFLPATGRAEFLYGEVVEINREKHEFVVAVGAAEKGKAEQEGKNVHINVRTMGGGLPPSGGRKPLLPGCVQLGQMVRVWGELHSEEAMFEARVVRGCRGKNCSDPTGVRSRLHGKNRRNCQNQQAGTDHIGPTQMKEGGGSEGNGRMGGNGHGGGGGRGR